MNGSTCLPPRALRGLARGVCVGMSFALLLGVALTTRATESGFHAPLAVANQSPVARLYGLPRAGGGALADAPVWSLRTEITNNFTAKLLGGDFVAFDGETTVVTLGFRAGLGERFELGIDLPFVRHAGGATDRIIDGFHETFGLPDSGRDGVPRNRVDYRLQLSGRRWFDLKSVSDGPGDASIRAGYRVVHGPARALALRAALELPTGKADDLTGSDGTDASVWLDYSDRALLARLGLEFTLMGGVSRLGRGRLLPDAQETHAYSGHAGLQYPLTTWLTLLAQLDAHTKLIDTPFDEVAGGALLGTLGGRLNLPRGLGLDLGVVEDLRSRSAPDVTFHVALSGRF